MYSDSFNFFKNINRKSISFIFKRKCHYIYVIYLYNKAVYDFFFHFEFCQIDFLDTLKLKRILNNDILTKITYLQQTK